MARITATEVAANLQTVRNRIDAAARRSGREAADVTLVAVSKTHPFWMIEAAMEAGQMDFGENRLEELWPKVEEAQQKGREGIRWHLIGTIQSRKSSLAVGPFALIHAVDRVKIANRLSRDAVAVDVVMPVLLEVNLSGEESKHGFSEEEIVRVAPDLAGLPGIEIRGLMTMAPYVDDPEAVRSIFRQLRLLRDRLQREVPNVDWRHLSMGMTNDYEVAVEEGATLVRVGSAIFGQRE